MTTKSLARHYSQVARRLVGHRWGHARKPATDPCAEPSPFETRAPSPQTAVDAASSPWVSQLPGHLTVRAGDTSLFADDRIARAIEAMGGVDGARVVELGPLEGGHSYMLESAGATVVGVEASKTGFLKCLIAKELLQLQRCSFFCGDAVAYFEDTDEQFDVCFASGILYHMVEPVRLIDLISQHASKLYIWTHYYSADRFAGNEFATQHLDHTPTSAEHRGYRHELYRFRYGTDRHETGFYGGAQAHSNWLTRDGLLGALEHFGWRDVKLLEDVDYLYGPAVSLTAARADDNADARAPSLGSESIA